MNASTSPTRPVRGARATALILTAQRGVYRIAKRWLWCVNALLLVTAALPFLAPLLAASGHRGLARPIYAFFSLTCHQRPDRSFFLRREKMACCHRCAAIYVGLSLAGLAFVLLRGRLHPLSWTGALL